MEQQQVRSDDHAALRAVGITCGVILALIAVAYVAGVVYFSGRVWPHTEVKGEDISLQRSGALTQTLQDMSDALSVRVSGQGVDFSLTSADAGLTLNVDAAARAILADVHAWQWPVQVLVPHDESDVLATSFDTASIEQSVESALASYNAQATDPVDAFVTYDAASGSYIVNPGSLGTKLDPDAVATAVVDALRQDRAQVTLTSRELVQQATAADDAALASSVQAANAYLRCNLALTLNGTAMATLDSSVVKDWVTFGEDGSVWLDDDKLMAWVDALEAKIDDVGSTRTYTRPDGKVVTVTGGTYGWITDGDGIESIVRYAVDNGSTGTEEIPLKQSAATFNPGGQDWGKRYVDVDLTEQHARFYDADGSIIWETDIISGATFDDRETPTGVYTLNNKAMNQTLIGKNDPTTGEPIYKTPVTYWMPFIGNSVGLHDASWQSAFGGTLYQTEAGSHGCINLPPDMAEELYSLIQVGDVVVTHN